MLKNYIRIALRNIRKYKGYSFINISGLAIGMAAFMIIYANVKYELNYDRRHENFDRIYRVTERQHYTDRILPVAVTPVPLAEAMKRDYPEIIETTRYTNTKSMLVQYNDKMFYEDDIDHADAAILKIFTIPLSSGDPNTALNEPNSALITQEIAEKYFENENPVGKTMRFDREHEITVTGVVKPLPKNSFLQFDFLVSFPTIKNFNGEAYMTRWENNTLYTFIMLPENHPYTDLESKIFDDLSRYRESEGLTKLHLQPLKDMHFESFWVADLGAKIEKKYIWMFVSIAIAILLIACINFMNLSTARSANRAIEVGMRKVVGARRFQLIKQFISESVLLACISYVFAIVLARLLLPYFDAVTGNDLTAVLFGDKAVFGQFLVLSIFVGIVAGSYPALFLSSFVPVKVLKGTIHRGTKNAFIRKGLVILQFSVSIALITSTIIIYQQLEFLKNKDLGFNKDQVVILPVREGMIRQIYEPFKRELVRNPRILNAAASNNLAGFGSSSTGYSWEGAIENEEILMNNYYIDHEFLDTFEMEIVAGRNFSRDFPSDTLNAVLINETAVKDFGWTSGVGKKINPGENVLNVIGVVKDFHFLPLNREMEPMIFFMNRGSVGIVSARIAIEQVEESIAYIEETWKKIKPDSPFEYFFLDSRFENRYGFVTTMQKMFGFFAILTIFIACLGLFGLASYTAEQRAKEIGIRKVLGASVYGIVNLLSVEFLKQVVVANVIAVLLAYAVMTRWLQDFAYRIELSAWSFVIAGTLALVIAILTVSYQAVKAAYANPVNALKYE